MSGKPILQRCLVGFLVVTMAAALPGDGPEKNAEKAKRATSADLGGPDRYLTHVSTDKPVYRGGETVYVRAVVLHADTHKPLLVAGGQSLVEIKGPKGDTVASGYAQIQDSVGGLAWPVPGEQAGGEYVIRVSHPWLGHPPAERKFDIRAFRAPRLKSQIVFARDGFGPGDEVAASLHVERAEGGFPAGANVTAVARVDGKEVYRGRSIVNAEGNCDVRFRLPAEIDRGEGTLALVIEDGGIVETAAKTLPILLQTLDLVFYPEGGELVAGLPCRVYLEARTPANKPADLLGHVVDSQGRKVADVRTEHEGRGRFELTPREGESYALKITEPSAIEKAFALPQVTEAGGMLAALRESYESGQAVNLKVGSAAGGPLTVTLSKKEIEVARTKLHDVAAGSVIVVELTPPVTADGVLIATLWDERGKPLAERLIYRQPAASVRVSVGADQASYVPGDKVKLTVKTTDEEGNPLSAVVGLTVTDDSVLEMIETREQAPRLPVMVLLENDVRELADAHVYLDPENPEAPRALDLLLGTQGWRRFAFVNTAKFLEAHGDDARRVLALKVVTRHDRRRFWFAERLAKVDGDGIELERAAVAVPVGKAAAAAPPDPEKPAPPPVQHLLEKKRSLREALDVAQDRNFRKRLLAGDVAKEPMPSSFLVVRVYAHQLLPDRRPGDRVDFTETLYWHAGVKTEAETGKATVSFALNDSVTAFRVLADAFTSDGTLGAGDTLIESVEPFYVEPKLPLEVTMGDEIQLPVGIVNGTAGQLTRGSLTLSSGKGISVPGGDRREFVLGPKVRDRLLVPLRVGEIVGERRIVLAATAGPHSDKVTRILRVAPLGFPVEVARGGLLQPDGVFSCTLEIPADLVPRSVRSEVKLYPTPLANLTDALQRLLREPNGCFEQTSSTTYPLVMAQQYFLTHSGVDPRLVERSNQLLEKGYKRLISFECKKQGYEWFGADPAHESLTAYGLLEFHDMAKVRQVDRQMLDRTRQWLLGTRDGEGNFKRERRALHTWVTDPDCSNGYILWSLLESGEPLETLAEEIRLFQNAASKSKNSYVIALGATVAAKTGDGAVAGKLMEKLALLQAKDGSVEGGSVSIVGSGGQALEIETTSLAVLAWLSDKQYAGNVERAMRWIAESCKNGRFGSTQSTVLALRAIIEYDKTRSRVTTPGSVRVHVDGHAVGEAQRFDGNSKSAIELPDISEMLFPGKHEVEIRMANGSEMPFSLAVTYHRTRPEPSTECKVGLEVSLADSRVSEGEVTEARVVVTNRAAEAVPTPVAIVGVPGGLEVRHDQLKELVEAGRIASYEVIGRGVVLYWRALAPREVVKLPLTFVAQVPGTYTGPASRAYLYYTDEHKHWVAPSSITVVPSAERE